LNAFLAKCELRVTELSRLFDPALSWIRFKEKMTIKSVTPQLERDRTLFYRSTVRNRNKSKPVQVLTSFS